MHILTHAPEIGALAEWQAEMRRGIRDRWTWDALWRAACAEARGRDAIRDGLHPSVVDDERRLAAEILLAGAERSA